MQALAPCFLVALAPCFLVALAPSGHCSSLADARRSGPRSIRAMTGPDDTTPVDVPFHPNVPKRRSVLLAFVGCWSRRLGGLIGWGLVDATCSEEPLQVQELLRAVPGYEVHTPSCDLQLLAGALFGAIISRWAPRSSASSCCAAVRVEGAPARPATSDPRLVARRTPAAGTLPRR